MKGSMRKLALWYTRTFKPIMTHDELEPIMATLGFVGRPAAATVPNSAVMWKEYVFCAAGGWRSKWGAANEPPLLPRPRLPYPRIDGLHIYSYRAFLEAVNFYLEMCDISDLFHIRYQATSVSSFLGFAFPDYVIFVCFIVRGFWVFCSVCCCHLIIPINFISDNRSD